MTSSSNASTFTSSQKMSESKARRRPRKSMDVAIDAGRVRIGSHDLPAEGLAEVE
jgi:hypothetical protein